METNLLVEIEDQDQQKILVNPAKVVAIKKDGEDHTYIYLFGREGPFRVKVPIDAITDIILKAMDFYNQSVMELMVETVRKEMKKDSKKEVFH